MHDDHSDGIVSTAGTHDDHSDGIMSADGMHDDLITIMIVLCRLIKCTMI